MDNKVLTRKRPLDRLSRSGISFEKKIVVAAMGAATAIIMETARV